MNKPYCKKICEKSSFSYPSNNMSTKQLQSKMIQIHKKISYNNSKTSTIFNIILQLDYEMNRTLLLRCKHKVYLRYLTQLLEGNITADKKKDLLQMWNAVLSSLSEKERSMVYEDIQKPTKVVNRPSIYSSFS